MAEVESIEMVDVGGVLARPEDVERITALQEGRPAPTPADSFRMLDIDGVQYRPEDAKRLGLVPADDDEPEEGDGEPVDPATVKVADTSEGEPDGDDGQPANAGGPGEAGEPAAPVKRQRRRS